MHISRLSIKNYRCFKDTTIYFDKYTCFVGVNGAGKSTILMALNVFFRNTKAPTDVINLQEEDFYKKNTAEPIEITVTFTDLSEGAKTDLKAYVRHNELTIIARAVWDDETSQAEVKQYGVRQVMADFVKYFHLEERKKRVPELRKCFNELRERYPDVTDATTKDNMRAALREYEENHPKACEPFESATQFYGWSKGANLLSKYIQWEYLPAIKDPTEEQDEQKTTTLGNILQRSIRAQFDFSDQLQQLQSETSDKYQRLLNDMDSVLDKLSNNIESNLHDWAHPGARVRLNWYFDNRKSISIADPYARASIGEGDFIGDIVRSGLGMQRSFLIAILQVLVNSGEGERPTLILGFEEPELFQHPPQAKHLASLLEELSYKDNQIIVTTHSPYFVSSKGYEQIRMVKANKSGNGGLVGQVDYAYLCDSLGAALECDPPKPTAMMAKVEQIMRPSQNELFFCKIPVFVEGTEDVALISSYIHTKDKWSEFRRLGCHFIVCNGKTSMSRPLTIANGLGLPVFVVFDGDCDKAVGNELEKHVKDNKCLLKLVGVTSEPLIEDNLFVDGLTMWKTRILDEIIEQIGISVWEKAEQAARNDYQLNSVKRKNPALITATIDKLTDSGINIELLEKLVNNIMFFAVRHSQ